MKIIKSLSVNKNLWNDAMKVAKKLDLSLSSLISGFLKKLVKKNKDK
jgi:antitoxin component of RelBE/YafQ-DinJ toxin-antitoxin module